jgi:hypothetical protein
MGIAMTRRSAGNAANRPGRFKGTRDHTSRRRSPWDELRCAYFAQAADVAARYGVTFDDLVAHLWNVRAAVGRIALGRINYVDDLVHASACMGRDGLAWAEFIERYEPLLIRRCAERIDEVEAILLTRRLLGELRSPDRTGGLHAYRATSSMRSWLTAKALRSINVGRGATCLPSGRGRRVVFSTRGESPAAPIAPVRPGVEILPTPIGPQPTVTAAHE